MSVFDRVGGSLVGREDDSRPGSVGDLRFFQPGGEGVSQIGEESRLGCQTEVETVHRQGHLPVLRNGERRDQARRALGEAVFAIARRAVAASRWRSPPSATRQAVTSDASSIEAWSRTSRYRSSHRADTRACRRGSSSAIRIVSSSSSARVGRPSVRSVVSATGRFRRSIARWKMALGWPCARVPFRRRTAERV